MDTKAPTTDSARRGSFLGLRPTGLPQLEFRILGRMLLHAAAVGLVAGLVGSAFFVVLELVQRLVLQDLAGYLPLRAAGERAVDEPASSAFRPWLLWILPGLGALGGGVVAVLFQAPEVLGGGGDAVLHVFHHTGGVVRRRVLWVKAVASVLTLGFGGSGGREGPTMQIGGAIGSIVARYLRVTPRERRILLVAGIAAGMAAVFRTPLGAALLSVEVLYRDDFESDALIPALLASVISYSVFITLCGEATLFAHAPSYPFAPAQLPWYALMAVLIAALSSVFLSLLQAVQRISSRIPVPIWVRPALGGLALGVCATPVVMFIGPRIGEVGQGIGIFGGGYGAAQVAITGASWLPTGWRGAEVLLLAGLVKIVATSLTVGTGGSAGDFGPSLVMGGLFGGAFGRALQGLLGDSSIDPGAFALVGMGTFYGGIAHVPVSSLVMVCELAGSYDLLVPLMLSEGIAFVALRGRSLYHAQVPTKADSPAHRHDHVFHALAGKKVGDLSIEERSYVTFTKATPGPEVMRRIAATDWQLIFPVLDGGAKICGFIDAEVLRTMTTEREVADLTVAADLMAPPLSVTRSDDLHWAIELMLRHHVREVVITDDQGKIIGFMDESDVTRAYLNELSTAEPARGSS